MWKLIVAGEVVIKSHNEITLERAKNHLIQQYKRPLGYLRIPFTIVAPSGATTHGVATDGHEPNGQWTRLRSATNIDGSTRSWERNQYEDEHRVVDRWHDCIVSWPHTPRKGKY